VEEEKILIKLIVAHAKCSNCGYERVLYFTSGYSYGERIVSTKDGKFCAYANLLEENVIPELTKICNDIFYEKNINISKNNIGRIVSKIYPITCDDINGQKMDDIPSWKCSNCFEDKMEEDKLFGEKVMEIQIPYVAHKTWDLLDKNIKRCRVEKELIKQGIII